MATKTISVKLINVTKTTAEWSTVADIITKGVLCVELTADGATKLKVGDGVNTYADLPYASDIDLSPYAIKTNVTQEIKDKIAALGNLFVLKGIVATETDLEAVDAPAPGHVYLVGADGETQDNYKEYVYTADNKWEYFGKVQVETDLSNYVTLDNTDYTDAVAKKHEHANKAILDATTASYTTAEAEKLAGLENYDDTALADRVTTLEGYDVDTRLDALETELPNLVSVNDTIVITCTL